MRTTYLRAISIHFRHHLRADDVVLVRCAHRQGGNRRPPRPGVVVRWCDRRAVAATRKQRCSPAPAAAGVSCCRSQ